MKKAIFNFWLTIQPTKHENKLNLITQEILTDCSTSESIKLLREINNRLEDEFLNRREFYESEIEKINSFLKKSSFKNKSVEVKKLYNHQFAKNG